MRRPEEYKHIAAWGRFQHSPWNYVREQQELAAKDNAPLDAIFKRNGEWATFSSVTNPDTSFVMKNILTGMNA